MKEIIEKYLQQALYVGSNTFQCWNGRIVFFWWDFMIQTWLMITHWGVENWLMQWAVCVNVIIHKIVFPMIAFGAITIHIIQILVKTYSDFEKISFCCFLQCKQTLVRNGYKIWQISWNGNENKLFRFSILYLLSSKCFKEYLWEMTFTQPGN